MLPIRKDRRRLAQLIDEIHAVVDTKHLPRTSYQGVRIVKISTFLKELEKQFSEQ